MKREGATLDRILRVLRRTGDEGQVTQLIAAFASGDPVFAGSLAKVLVGAVPYKDRLGPVPNRLTCTPESQLVDAAGTDLGYVDLRFEDEAAESSPCWSSSSCTAATAGGSWSATATRSRVSPRAGLLSWP